MIDLEAYLSRIGHTGSREATVETLRALMLAHGCAVPFENLTPFVGQPVSLELADLEAKLVTERRGGYCYEHNTLFMAVLEAFGFDVMPMLARVRWQVPAGVVTGRSHMCLRVRIDGVAWLVDVGFGGIGTSGPIALDVEGTQETPHERRRLLSEAEGTVLHQVEIAPEQWADVFQLEPVRAFPVDIATANWFTSTHPDSFFRQSLIVTLIQPDHRRVLHDRDYLCRYRDGRVERREIESIDALRVILTEAFGIPADNPILASLRLPDAGG